MSQTADDIRLEQRRVDNEVEEVSDQLRAVNQTTEEYEEFFYYLSAYTLELEECYGQSSFGWYFADQADGLHRQRQAIFDSLNLGEEDLKKQRYDLENQWEELEFTRKKLVLEEEEAHG